MTGRLVRKCLAWFQGHAIPSSTCKIAVMKPKAVLESTCILRFPAARVNPPLTESASGLSTASAVMPVVRFTCCARSTRSKYQIWGLKRRTRLHDVHVCKRMSFAGSAGSICKLIQMWELLGHKPVCTRMKGIGGHVIPSSTCKIAVMKPKVVLESTLIFIRFPAARVKSPLRERECLRTIYSFSGDVRGSIHMLQTTFRAPYWLLSARSTRAKYHVRGLNALDKNA